MKFFGLEITRARKSGLSIDTVIRRLEALYETASGISVTPENCMQSPTVNAIVTGISRRIATLPIRVLKKGVNSDGRAVKRALLDHPVSSLLIQPNDFQDRVTFWLDATSWLVRYGNFYAVKSAGRTGPIRRLTPLVPSGVEVSQDDLSLALSYKVSQPGGGQREYLSAQVMHARGLSRNGFTGVSPVSDVREAIALEIAAEKMGAAVFGNNASPGLIFKYAPGSQGHRTDEERKKFVENLEDKFRGKGRFRMLLMPNWLEFAQSLTVENEKAQFLATRQYQRTVIAGTFGVPPHLVGDLSSGKFNNVEQQSLDFITNVVLPFIRIFEAALERSLLSPEDRAGGVIIRFNLDAALRADFAARQTGLNIQRQAGVINVNEWREIENMNPISVDDGGEEYWRQGPSGQSASADAASAGDENNPSTDGNGSDGTASN